METKNKAALAARKIHKHLSERAKDCGSDPKYVFLWSPEEANKRGYGLCWTVCWEEGPFEWAYNSKITEMVGENVLAEPHCSFILCFYLS